MIEAGFHASPYIGYVYPNETIIPWTIMIVVYPFMTGLVAGAFSVSSMYHVFGMENFKPVARFALLTALCFMLFVPMTLLLHLGQPQRAFNAMITPHLTSAFAAFGYFAAFYAILLMLEVWFAFRVDNVIRARNSTGLVRRFYRAITLWSDDISEKAQSYDHKWMLTLAIVGIPAAHGLHGYVGFVFGSLKSREWWGSDMMPVIFLFSAIISGVAVLIVLYTLVSKIRKTPIDESCVRGMAGALWGFLMFTLLLEGLEFANVVYKGKEGIEIIMEYVTGPLFYRYFVFQFGFGAILPIIILGLMFARLERGDQRPGDRQDHARPADLSRSWRARGLRGGVRRAYGAIDPAGCPDAHHAPVEGYDRKGIATGRDAGQRSVVHRSRRSSHACSPSSSK